MPVIDEPMEMGLLSEDRDDADAPSFGLVALVVCLPLGVGVMLVAALACGL